MEHGLGTQPQLRTLPSQGMRSPRISLLSAPFHEEGKGQHLRGLQGLFQLLRARARPPVVAVPTLCR